MNTPCATTPPTVTSLLPHPQDHSVNPFPMSTRPPSRKVILKGPKPPSKPRGGRAKKTADLDKEDTAADPKSGTLRIMWNEPRTERLVEWLEDNVEDRQRLFSDSAQDAKEEKRRPRTAKGGKVIFHTKIANYVFSVDEDPRVRDDMKAHGAQYFAKVVENRIAR